MDNNIGELGGGYMELKSIHKMKVGDSGEVDINSIRCYMREPRAEKVEAKKYLITHGQRQSIKVLKGGRIVDGYASYIAYRELGYKSVFVEVVDGDINYSNNKSRSITLLEVYIRDNGICYICGRKCIKPEDWGSGKEKTKMLHKLKKENFEKFSLMPTIDHVVPLSSGGADNLSNMRLCCTFCNYCKSDRKLTEGVIRHINNDLVRMGFK